MDITLEMWKDNRGIRLSFNGGEDLDFSYEAAQKLVEVLDEYLSEPIGKYRILTFDVSDNDSDVEELDYEEDFD
jgi:hypothetical protein